MKKHYFFLLIVSLFQAAYAQDTKTEVFRTNSIINVPAGQKIECISAEGKYSYETYDSNSGSDIYKGPRFKIIKDASEFVYPVAPIGVDTTRGIFRGVNLWGNGLSWVPSSSWVYSGDGSSLTIDGPASITYQNTSSNGEPFLFTYKISNTAGSNTVSATAVVIPQSATGDVDVKMEQSADNVTWTECLPGTYNSSTVKRFFRLRAVEK